MLPDALQRPHRRAGEGGRDGACGLRHAARRERLARDLVPAQAEVRGDVRDERAPDPQRGVVPADRAALRMAGLVEAVAGQGGEVDAADEGDAVVDHDELLVMAVERSLAAVAGDGDAPAGP